ncbi:hypothetical protein AAMO2058_000308800 [Amorphochlora amoebiformis]
MGPLVRVSAVRVAFLSGLLACLVGLWVLRGQRSRLLGEKSTVTRKVIDGEERLYYNGVEFRPSGIPLPQDGEPPRLKSSKARSKSRKKHSRAETTEGAEGGRGKGGDRFGSKAEKNEEDATSPVKALTLPKGRHRHPLMQQIQRHPTHQRGEREGESGIQSRSRSTRVTKGDAKGDMRTRAGDDAVRYMRHLEPGMYTEANFQRKLNDVFRSLESKEDHHPAASRSKAAKSSQLTTAKAAVKDPKESRSAPRPERRRKSERSREVDREVDREADREVDREAHRGAHRPIIDKWPKNKEERDQLVNYINSLFPERLPGRKKTGEKALRSTRRAESEPTKPSPRPTAVKTSKSGKGNRYIPYEESEEDEGEDEDADTDTDSKDVDTGDDDSERESESDSSLDNDEEDDSESDAESDADEDEDQDQDQDQDQDASQESDADEDAEDEESYDEDSDADEDADDDGSYDEDEDDEGSFDEDEEDEDSDDEGSEDEGSDEDDEEDYETSDQRDDSKTRRKHQKLDSDADDEDVEESYSDSYETETETASSYETDTETAQETTDETETETESETASSKAATSRVSRQPSPPQPSRLKSKPQSRPVPGKQPKPTPSQKQSKSLSTPSSSGRSKIKKGKEASPLGSDGPRGQTQAVGRHVTEEEMQHIIREMERAIQANYEAGMSGKARPSPKPMDDKLDKALNKAERAPSKTTTHRPERAKGTLEKSKSSLKKGSRFASKTMPNDLQFLSSHAQPNANANAKANANTMPKKFPETVSSHAMPKGLVTSWNPTHKGYIATLTHTAFATARNDHVQVYQIGKHMIVQVSQGKNAFTFDLQMPPDAREIVGAQVNPHGTLTVHLSKQEPPLDWSSPRKPESDFARRFAGALQL